jgi:hypothetical protein
LPAEGLPDEGAKRSLTRKTHDREMRAKTLV